ncbi:MAG: hypothetical protein LQ342_005803 [Letrouitia transgressa]|nr:MAG: hypothetical protein LQ342_005803 [Letrouitia transgressa]
MTPSVKPDLEHSGFTGSFAQNRTFRRRSASCTSRSGQPSVREDNLATRNEPLPWEVSLAERATATRHFQAINHERSDHFQDLNPRRPYPPTSNIMQATVAECYPDQQCWKQVVQDSTGGAWYVHWHRLEAKETASCFNQHQKHIDKSPKSSPLDTEPGKPNLWDTPTRKPYDKYGPALPLTPPSTDRSMKFRMNESSPLENRRKRNAVSPRRPAATSTVHNDSSQTTGFGPKEADIEQRPSSSSSFGSSSTSVASSSTSVNSSSFAAKEWLDVFTDNSGYTTAIKTIATTHHGDLEHDHLSTTEKVEVAAVIPSQIQVPELKEMLGIVSCQCHAVTQEKKRCKNRISKIIWENIEEILREAADLMNNPASNQLKDCINLIKKISEMIHCKNKHQEKAPAKLQSWEPIIIEAWNRSSEEKTSAKPLCHIKVEEITSIPGDTAEGTVTCETKVSLRSESIDYSFLSGSPVSKIRNLTPYINESLTIEEIVKNQVEKPLTKNEEQDEGEVYIYWVPGNFGLAKIGWTRKDVDDRLKGWRRQCGHLPRRIFPTEYVTKPIPHAKRVELLIHAELNGMRRRECECDKCGKSHNEWFEVSNARAIAVAEKWTAWMLKEPYADDGKLKDPTAKLPKLEDLSSHKEPGGHRYNLRPRAKHTSSTGSHAHRRSPRLNPASPHRRSRSVGALL